MVRAAAEAVAGLEGPILCWVTRFSLWNGSKKVRMRKTEQKGQNEELSDLTLARDSTVPRCQKGSQLTPSNSIDPVTASETVPRSANHYTVTRAAAPVESGVKEPQEPRIRGSHSVIECEKLAV